MSREKRISNELERLSGIFKEIEPNKRVLVEGLIHRASFMRIALEDYEVDINENGGVEMFSQSENLTPYERARPVMQFYQTMNKNYQTIIKQLVGLLPDVKQKETLSDIVSGLQKP